MPSKFNKKSSNINYGKSNEFSYNTSNYSKEQRDFVWYDYPFTIICTAFLITIHFLFWILSPTDIVFSIPPKYVDLFAQNNWYVINGGISQWYRVITSIFIHANIIHLGGNLLFLIIFSLRLEELKGWKVTFSVFMIAGICGNLLTLMFFGPILSLTTLGASGAVMGVFMADLITMRKTYEKGSLTMLAFLVVFGSLFIDGSASTNIFAHLGGLIGGAAFMLFLEKYERKYGLLVLVSLVMLLLLFSLIFLTIIY